MVLEIEVEGARQVRDAIPSAVLVFIAPPSQAALRRRLEERGTDAPATIAKRLAVAEEELAARNEFPHVIVNDQLDAAVGALEEIYLRPPPPPTPSR